MPEKEPSDLYIILAPPIFFLLVYFFIGTSNAIYPMNIVLFFPVAMVSLAYFAVAMKWLFLPPFTPHRQLLRDMQQLRHRIKWILLLQRAKKTLYRIGHLGNRA